jgi:hypothetical protein
VKNKKKSNVLSCTVFFRFPLSSEFCECEICFYHRLRKKKKYMFILLSFLVPKKKPNEMCVMTIIEMNYHDNELNKMKELFI